MHVAIGDRRGHRQAGSAFGGSEGRQRGHGRGVITPFRRRPRRVDLDLKGARVAVRGTETRASRPARFISEVGAKVIAVTADSQAACSTATGSIWRW